MKQDLATRFLIAGKPGDGADSPRGAASRSRRWWRWLLYAILGVVLTLVAVVAYFWFRPPLDTRPPEAKIDKVVPNKPLLEKDQHEVTFVLKDEQDGIPTFFIFEGEDQKATALLINTLRRTPNERGVEVRFEAVRFRRDIVEPDKLWPRAVGIANEAAGKTPLSLAELDSGKPIDLHFHDEKEVPFVTHVFFDIYMTVQYDRKSQLLTLTNASGSIRWKTIATDAFDEGKLETKIVGRKGEYAEKPLLEL